MAYQNQFSVSNGTTDVTVLAAPAASTSRTVRPGGINIFNNDTADITVTLQVNDNSTDRVLDKATISAGDAWSNDKFVICLDATNQTLEIFLAGAVAANEADISVVYRDEAQ